MTTKNNKITEITDDELYELYLRRGMEGGGVNEEAKI